MSIPTICLLLQKLNLTRKKTAARTTCFAQAALTAMQNRKQHPELRAGRFPVCTELDFKSRERVTLHANEAYTEPVQNLRREYWTSIGEVKLSDARFYR